MCTLDCGWEKGNTLENEKILALPLLVYSADLLSTSSMLQKLQIFAPLSKAKVLWWKFFFWRKTLNYIFCDLVFWFRLKTHLRFMVEKITGKRFDELTLIILSKKVTGKIRTKRVGKKAQHDVWRWQKLFPITLLPEKF